MGVAFAAISKYPGLWRVDGISSVSLDNNSRPRCCVYFSKIKDDALKGKYSYQNCHLDREHETPFIAVNFPFSALMWFTVGSLWKNGVKVEVDAPTVTASVSINASNVQNLKLDSKVRLGGKDVHVLPSSHFSFGGTDGNFKHLRNSNYALVEVVNPTFETTQYLVIPHTEIFRFYYAMSSRLCNSIVAGGINKYVDLRTGKSSAGKQPVLFTKVHLSRLERIVFLRALSNSDASEGLRRTKKELTIGKRSGKPNEPLPLFSVFPFTDQTTLSIEGKKICLKDKDSGGDPIWATFVTRIITCRRPFDFENPTIVYPLSSTLEAGSGSGTESPEAVGRVPFKPALPLDDEEFDELFGVDSEPSSARISRLALLSPSHRFPETYRIDYDFRHVDGSVTDRPTRFDQAEEEEYNSIDEGGYSREGKGGRGVDKVIDEIKPPRSLHDFIRMVKVLRMKLGSSSYRVSTRRNIGEVSIDSENVSVFPHMPSRFKWYLSDLGGPRKVIWVEVLNLKSGKCLHFLEMEMNENDSKSRSTATLIPRTGKEVSSVTITKFLKLAAYRRGWCESEYACKKSREVELAEIVFSLAEYARFTHLENVTNYTEELIDAWASQAVEKVRNYLE